jgi:ABC-type uncharacterized transport system substrate-binding protein
MKNKKSMPIVYIGIVILIAGLLVGSYFMLFYSPYKFQGKGPIKIFHLNSYAPGFGWSDETIEGFKGYLEKENVSFEIKEFYMNSFDMSINQTLVAKEVVNAISEWKPDLIYATDDEAQREVISKYYVNSRIPVVFSGVNLYAETYGYDKASNVAGVLEREQLKSAVDYLRQISPSNIRKIAVISDGFYQWDVVMEQLKQQQAEIPDVEFVGWQGFPGFEGYKKAILDYQDKVDAFILLPPIALSDENGVHVSEPDAVRWTVENSKLPELSFWDLQIYLGALEAVYVSPIEQGERSAKIAEEILFDGKKPSSIPFETTKKAIRVINIARAETLGIEKKDISSTVLINSQVYEGFPWVTEAVKNLHG